MSNTNVDYIIDIHIIKDLRENPGPIFGDWVVPCEEQVCHPKWEINRTLRKSEITTLLLLGKGTSN